MEQIDVYLKRDSLRATGMSWERYNNESVGSSDLLCLIHAESVPQ